MWLRRGGWWIFGLGAGGGNGTDCEVEGGYDIHFRRSWAPRARGSDRNIYMMTSVVNIDCE
jgi:hypothetical protein